MTKKYSLVFIALLCSFFYGFGQGSESFTNLNAATGSYGDGSYAGDNGLTWTYTEARRVTGTYNITGTSIGFGTSGTRNVSATSDANGVGDLTYSVSRYFTGGTAAQRSIEVYVNGTLYDSYTLAAEGPIYTRNFTANETGAVLIEFRSVGSRQILIDDVSWTAASTCAPPSDPTGTISVTQNCGDSNLSFSTSSSNLYWQTSATGTDLSSDTTTPYNVTSDGTYYLRAYDGTSCWSSGTMSQSVTIANTVNISAQPTDQSITTGNTATFSVTATNAASYQWQVSTDGVIWTPIGTNANSLTINNVPLSQDGYMYRVIVSSIGCPDITSNVATLNVFNSACVDEDFVAFGDWTNSGTIEDSDITHYGNAAPCRAFEGGDSMITPSVDNPEFLQFHQDASNGGNGNTATVEYRIGAGAWTPLLSFTVTNAGNTESVDLTNVAGVDLSNETTVTFRFNSTFSTWYLDDVKIFCTPCTAPITTTTINLSSGPIGTFITINGSDFTGATTVTFNGVTATISSQTASELIVQVPSGATDGDIVVTTPGSIYCDSNIAFDIIEAEIACQTTLDPLPTDLFFYEIFDEDNTIDTPINYGNGGMITIFNGTNQTKNLSDYRIYRDGSYNAGSPNFVLFYAPTGQLAPGEMFRLKITSSVCNDGPGGYQMPYSDISATGWNADDAIELRTFNSMTSAWDNAIDQFLAPADPGYYYQRDITDTTVEPAATFALGDWTEDLNIVSGNACREVGVIPNFTGGPPTLTQSNSGATCDVATLTVNAQEGYNGSTPADARELNFEWYYYDTVTDIWNPISTGGDYTITTTNNGTGSETSELEISNVYNKIDYQFYCRVRESDVTCFKPTDAIKLNIESTTWTTSWDNGAPTASRIAIINGAFSTGTNGAGNGNIDACQLIINTGGTVNVGNSSYVHVVNNVINQGIITVATQGSFVQDGDGVDAGTFTNSGSGTASVNKTTATFNSNISNYNYTYWSSPVIETRNIETIFPNAVGNRRYKFTAENFKDSTKESGNNNAIVNGQDDIDDDDNDWQIADGFTLLPGKGYAVTATINVVIPPNPNYSNDAQFIGAFNTGDIFVDVYKNDDEIDDNNWNFIGNPYPSAISISTFLTDNAIIDTTPTDNETDPPGIIDGAVFLWSQGSPPDANNNGNQNLNFNQSDYAIVNGLMGTAGGNGIEPNPYIPSGQGFFISYDHTAGEIDASGLVKRNQVKFTNNMRTTGNNAQFFGPNLDLEISDNKIWLNLTSDNGVFSQIGIGYVDKATDSYDGWYFDTPRNLSTGTYASLYSIIDSSDKQFAIQGKSPESLNLDEIIPLGFDTSIDIATIYTLSIPKLEGGFMNQNDIFIKDNLLSITHNLKESGYNFTSEVGEFNNRFEIVFTEDALSVGEIKIDDNTLQIVELQNGDVQFKLSSQFEMKSIEIIDLLGRTLYKLNTQGNSQTFSLNNLSQAAYLAKVELTNGHIITKKALKRK